MPPYTRFQHIYTTLRINPPVDTSYLPSFWQWHRLPYKGFTYTLYLLNIYRPIFVNVQPDSSCSRYSCCRCYFSLCWSCCFLNRSTSSAWNSLSLRIHSRFTLTLRPEANHLLTRLTCPSSHTVQRPWTHRLPRPWGVGGARASHTRPS